ncbi:hypothetical protein SPRG_14830 [Saprolegnia parasitica CBS 223.65]|uniref:Uncharacterized protein n=1 Tax=Saprolegnia parasitica (strain CBS 223.65) TaxID=695850 RepID=A0A067BZB5_SAPPC|nr:hypothetical protein SPRG_14830 [Saprolegnia parasitica CBS 223.65]KDO19922.1 hypothetical protein SPRG_14830 [Saprolegnia parasitica CBS 223.65]|eukprot:XP_012209362.1 hypothetical protein SPRG_14830 [Saprolegnia parasitica CBS 223.65]
MLDAAQFSTPRGAARRVGSLSPGPPPGPTDHRFTSPRGSAPSFRVPAPVLEPAVLYSSDESDEAPTRRPSMVKASDVFSLTRHNRLEQVDAMLAKGLPVNLQDAHGNSLLIIACQNGLKRLAKMLLRRGANINLQNARGNTPLHYCFAYGYGETLGAYLISKGADVALRNEDGLECYYGIKPPVR